MLDPRFTFSILAAKHCCGFIIASRKKLYSMIEYDMILDNRNDILRPEFETLCSYSVDQYTALQSQNLDYMW